MYREAWKYYLKFYQGYSKKFAGVIIISSMQALLLLPVALMIKYAFDEIIPQKDFSSLAFLSLGILCLYLINNWVSLWARRHTLDITKIAIQRYRDELLGKVFSLSRYFYTQSDRNKLQNNIVQDSERLDVMTNHLVGLFLPSLLISVALTIILFFLDWTLVVSLLGILPIIYFSGRFLGKRFRSQVKVFHQKFENFNKGMGFILRMLDLTKIQTAEELVIEKQRNRHDELRISSGKMSWYGTAYRLVQNMIVVCGGVIILLIGGRAVISGKMTLGALLSFYYAFGLLREHVRNIQNSVPDIIEGNQSLMALYEIMNIPDLIPYSGNKTISFGGKIKLDSVYFQYGEKTVLKNVNMEINPQTTVALVGSSGAGKSTIINIILGFYRPKLGQIFADGFPYEDLDLRELRKTFGVVLQDSMIFPGTIAENIIFGLRDFDDRDLFWASELATANEFIKDLPEGYDTYVGEGGVLLSGGQCQRLAIARSLMRKPTLLILDEPTNHLDMVLVKKILGNLKIQKTIKSTLLVSHNEKILPVTDLIYMVEKGRIVETGHPSQFKENEIYQNLFQTGST